MRTLHSIDLIRIIIELEAWDVCFYPIQEERRGFEIAKNDLLYLCSDYVEIVDRKDLCLKLDEIVNEYRMTGVNPGREEEVLQQVLFDVERFIEYYPCVVPGFMKRANDLARERMAKHHNQPS